MSKKLHAVRCQFSLTSDTTTIQAHTGMVICADDDSVIAIYDINGLLILPGEIRSMSWLNGPRFTIVGNIGEV